MLTATDNSIATSDTGYARDQTYFETFLKPAHPTRLGTELVATPREKMEALKSNRDDESDIGCKHETVAHFGPLYGTYGYRKDSECRKYVCHGRALDYNQGDVFSDNAQKLWWHVEFISRHEDDIPWNEELAYNVQIRKRWRRNFYLSERKLAESLCLTRTTIRKHLANFQAKGLLIVVRDARYAPSMQLQRRATTYALGPNFHCMPDIQPDGTDSENEVFSCLQRVGHNSVISKNTVGKNSRAKKEHSESNTQQLEPKKIETIEATIEGNGKPLPLSGQFLSDLQIENINSKNLPRHLSPQYTLPSRLKTRYLQKLAKSLFTIARREDRQLV